MTLLRRLWAWLTRPEDPETWGSQYDAGVDLEDPE